MDIKARKHTPVIDIDPIRKASALESMMRKTFFGRKKLNEQKSKKSKVYSNDEYLYPEIFIF
jgi:hypothetical protein